MIIRGTAGLMTGPRRGVEEYLSRYPTIRIVLDVHRGRPDRRGRHGLQDAGHGGRGKDGAGDDGDRQRRHRPGPSQLGGKPVPGPVHMQRALNDSCPTPGRPITLRTSRFNQQLTTGSLLVEVGSHGNTLQEAIRGRGCLPGRRGEVFMGFKTAGES